METLSLTDELLSIRSAARRLGTGRHTVLRLIHAGELRAFRVRSVIRISPFDLRDYLMRHRIEPRLSN
jgi:excisionase family DNA binding protein